MEGPVQKNYKIILMHQFWIHKTYKPKWSLQKSWLLKQKLPPCILDNEGYHFIFVNDFSQTSYQWHDVLEALYNKELYWCRNVIGNTFEMLKNNFRELLLKTNLHVLFSHDNVVYYCILYNMILDGKELDMETLMF